MQANNGWIITTIILVGVAIILANSMLQPEIPMAPTASAIAAFIQVPTAQEVADLIVIPDTPDTILSLREELKAEAIAVCDEEFDLDELAEKHEVDDDEIELIKEYTDDRVYSNVMLGIDNADDRQITIQRTYKVEIDEDEREKDTISCIVTSDDGDLEANIRY